MGLSKPPLTPQSNAQLQAIAWRMLSVPDLVCATADGAGLLLPLEHLQVSSTTVSNLFHFSIHFATDCLTPCGIFVNSS